MAELLGPVKKDLVLQYGSDRIDQKIIFKNEDGNGTVSIVVRRPLNLYGLQYQDENGVYWKFQMEKS